MLTQDKENFDKKYKCLSYKNNHTNPTSNRKYLDVRGYRQF